MARIVWLCVSTTKTVVPFASTATPYGYLKRAARPTPSALPGCLARPASVDTAPVARLILRMVLLSMSATKAVSPDAVTATPRGL